MVNQTQLPQPQTIGVLGAGSYGTALAIAFAKVMPVVLWGHRTQAMQEMAVKRENSEYLPEIPFPENLEVTDNLESVLKKCTLLIIAVPSAVLPDFLKSIKNELEPHHFLLIASKGLEQKTGRFFSDIIPEIFPHNHFGFISGPSFAKEVARGIPTALAVASKDTKFLRNQIFAPMHKIRQPLKLYYVEDMIGLQIAGAIKNVIAIAVGLSDGLGYGANTRAAVITHGLEEISTLGKLYGADASTFQGLSGFGDLILTCTDDQSRNRRFGLYLGQGLTPEQAIEKIGQVVEGYYNTRETMTLARKVNVELPIIQKVYDILFNHKSPKRAAGELLLAIHNL
ncbi:NAD(P)H-dependent glycerol-3-phosphate dehydrogenase [Psittacicella gerlachiana]|uniref:Glycerol-3-phosphate dehydrogenase [NAD(P)+] n=1 Tax=Psittacicella gerlachiana TaxID=2028574 RepID=A0A3A1YJE8_9GAMM|nr:NAD(P)H-dependent glycerol-3-phosphate dehydrogenase [Psittacicella gerlachiana]RIY37180.1 hypothetical protein CKF59_01875 [Psittacicella gerlachiana]